MLILHLLQCYAENTWNAYICFIIACTTKHFELAQGNRPSRYCKTLFSDVKSDSTAKNGWNSIQFSRIRSTILFIILFTRRRITDAATRSFLPAKQMNFNLWFNFRSIPNVPVALSGLHTSWNVDKNKNRHDPREIIKRNCSSFKHRMTVKNSDIIHSKFIFYVFYTLSSINITYVHRILKESFIVSTICHTFFNDKCPENKEEQVTEENSP